VGRRQQLTLGHVRRYTSGESLPIRSDPLEGIQMRRRAHVAGTIAAALAASPGTPAPAAARSAPRYRRRTHFPDVGRSSFAPGCTCSLCRPPLEAAGRRARVAAVLLCVAAAFGSPAAAQPLREDADRLQGAARAAATVDLARLREIQTRHEASLLARPGVIAIGIGLDEASDRLVFVVGVEVSGKPPDVPAALDGVAVRIEPREPLRTLHGGNACIPCHVDDRVPGFIEMGNSIVVNDDRLSSCTLGFVACDRARKQLVFVTNSHCAVGGDSCPGTAPIGTSVLHPGSRGPEIGRVSAHAPPDCGRTNRVDATAVDTDGYRVTFEVRDVGFPALEPGTVLPGDRVQKSGATTGRTFAEIVSVNQTVGIRNDCCGSFLFVDQIDVLATGDVFALPGDSGSAVLTRARLPVVVGLLFAVDDTGRRGSVNPIAAVFEALDLIDLEECLCAAETAMVELDPALAEERVERLRELNDHAFARSAFGLSLRQRYERFSGEVGVLLLRNRLLRTRTRRVLERLMPALDEITAGRPVVVREREIRRVERLVRAYARAGSQELRAALVQFREELRDPERQADLGVTVTPKGGKPGKPGPF
jgi:hypothetical protein